MQIDTSSSAVSRGGKRRRNPVANRRHQSDWYWRNKRCQAAYGCDADDRVIDMLVDRKYLAEHERDNPREIKLGITVLLADLAKAHRTKKYG